MDAHLTVASMRDARSYDGAPVPDDVARRILDSGRLAGSARNRQPTRFIVVGGEAVAAVARTVYRADNVLTAGLVLVICVSPGGNLVDFDAGRAAQSMMLSAWADGVGARSRRRSQNPSRTGRASATSRTSPPRIAGTM